MRADTGALVRNRTANVRSVEAPMPAAVTLPPLFGKGLYKGWNAFLPI
ncbi:hypothetical protein GCM10010178_91700 [Lentzea flava]|uniref:Uncharacterized protein n=1 Tax=Lentzea flava TaxID=103732 RepID=A0ABQ2VIQ8_9PSEU|nr:hypothetical protein GCM10010178_91700 [Lentzea flava]